MRRHRECKPCPPARMRPAAWQQLPQRSWAGATQCSGSARPQRCHSHGDTRRYIAELRSEEAQSWPPRQRRARNGRARVLHALVPATSRLPSGFTNRGAAELPGTLDLQCTGCTGCTCALSHDSEPRLFQCVPYVLLVRSWHFPNSQPFRHPVIRTTGDGQHRAPSARLTDHRHIPMMCMARVARFSRGAREALGESGECQSASRGRSPPKDWPCSRAWGVGNPDQAQAAAPTQPRRPVPAHRRSTGVR